MARLLKGAANDADLGSGARDRMQIVAAYLYLAVLSAIGLRARLRVPIPLALPSGRHVFWVTERSEFLALSAIFLGGEYARTRAPAPAVILDLGANVGAATLYFNMRFPRARIFAVEPEPWAFEVLERNVAGLGRVRALNCAVGDTSRRARFVRSTQSWASRLATDGDPAIGLEVDVLSFDDLLARLSLDHVDLAKIDIEGAEFGLLESATRLSSVDEVIGELHPDHPDAPPDVRSWLDGIAVRAGLTVITPGSRGGGPFALHR